MAEAEFERDIRAGPEPWLDRFRVAALRVGLRVPIPGEWLLSRVIHHEIDLPKPHDEKPTSQAVAERFINATGYPSKCDCFRMGDNSCLVKKLAQFQQGSSGPTTADPPRYAGPYHLRDAIAVRAGDAWESAIVAQLVPAAEIH